MGVVFFPRVQNGEYTSGRFQVNPTLILGILISPQLGVSTLAWAIHITQHALFTHERASCTRDC